MIQPIKLVKQDLMVNYFIIGVRLIAYELILCDYKEHTRFVSAYKVDVLSMVKDFTEQFSNVEISADGKENLTHGTTKA